MTISTVCVVGLGYIGLPTATMFANAGKSVRGVDINFTAVDMINNGKAHIKENGLDELLRKVVEEGKLKADTTPAHADVFIIAVPTPHNEDYTANLDAVVAATKAILPYLKKDNIVIVESTIPPRTINDVVAPIINSSEWKVGEEIYLAHCPERVLPGKILDELVNNTRIVGGVNEISATKAAEVYRSFVKAPILETTALIAEMSKLMENTYRDVNIALANELVKISSDLEIDALEVIKLANHHPRVNIHLPGPGVGGHCLAVDPYFIIEKSPQNAKLISDARHINKSMPQFVIEYVEKLVGKKTDKIAVLGLTYKGDIDDIRESPALLIAQSLMEKGYYLNIHDPYVRASQVPFKMWDFEEAITDADCILVLTDHSDFKNLDQDLIIKKCKKPVILDTKNCVNIDNTNINYYNFGNLYEIEERLILV
ncbi:UDP-N-acetyl-D-mannosamine dehydrogenase [Bacillus mycoides]|uniref:nucleotide sugar dehydrogenase n=1 Tax=Bacillus cereus group TaxID=86661 RepID=UPI0008733D2B|nr:MULTISPECIES: nucleotide sugar dehydrogenase [Bacillus cereus group]MBJ8072273.1 nucleotide sugar dehydrogenase [Bacillus cereus]MDM5465106.1 nucleotide sugar dehydrogenase [Bacillus cereus]OFD38238.1 UDP-N-acetyl-D-mannosamine dehydrogenase [Bacillus mycoides]OFD40636.1 UDP-N-acetyl-D-mannosamine dehydrogenase [Bacillus mycoides]OFD55641.1 UDP-N-acetyl-D-mannosamine dehydrogenase [Bacillus mycoides]